MKTFSQAQIAYALKKAGALPDSWHPANDTLLDENGSRTRVGVLAWMPNAIAWKAWLAEKRAPKTESNVLPLTKKKTG